MPAAQAAGTTQVSGPIGSQVLTLGDHGQAVRVLQGDLSQFGYFDGRVTGAFDSATQSALEAFQRARGLSADGILDQATFDALLQEGGWSAPWTASSASGPQPVPTTSVSASAPQVQASQETINMTATAYGPTLQDNYPYGPVDYFGKPLKAGDVAVDPRIIPLGAKLYVSGYSSPFLPSGGFYAVARDTGGAIKGDRIDIFINGSESQVNSFGIQHVKVTVLSK